MPIPTPAERARTILRLAPCLRVRTPGAWAEVDLHGTDPDGSVVLVLAEQSPVVGAVRRAGADLPGRMRELLARSPAGTRQP